MWNDWELKRPSRTGALVSCASHFICVHHIRGKIPSSVCFFASHPFPSFTPRSCLLPWESFLSVYLSVLVGFVCADIGVWVCLMCVRVCVLSLYSLLMYSAAYILPFQVLQVLLTSQTLGTCSWACRVWMGILTKGHKLEPMYSHR